MVWWRWCGVIAALGGKKKRPVGVAAPNGLTSIRLRLRRRSVQLTTVPVEKVAQTSVRTVPSSVVADAALPSQMHVRGRVEKGFVVLRRRQRTSAEQASAVRNVAHLPPAHVQAVPQRTMPPMHVCRLWTVPSTALSGTAVATVLRRSVQRNNFQLRTGNARIGRKTLLSSSSTVYPMSSES